MSLSKKTSYMLAVGGALLATSGFLAARRYKNYKWWKDEVGSIPWDVPQEYTSWKTLFRGTRHYRFDTVK